MESAPSKNYVFKDFQGNMWFALKGDRRCFCFSSPNLTCNIVPIEEVRKAYKATKARAKTPMTNRVYFDIDPAVVNIIISRIVKGYNDGSFFNSKDTPLDF